MKPSHTIKLSTHDDRLHPSYQQLTHYIQGELDTVDAQLTGHHIMNCARCESIWEKLIRQMNEKPLARPSYLQNLRALIL